MGGFGSGRNEYAENPTVERCRHVDVNRLKDALEKIGRSGTLRWGEKEDSAAISFLVEGDTNDDGGNNQEDAVDDEHEPQATGFRLVYTTTDTRTDETENHDYVVPVEWTPCNFGGRRPWFRCPRCDDRVGKLYLPPRGHYFLCRDCHDLSYRSSRKSGNDFETAELRYRRAFEKADKDDRRPHPNNPPYLPEKSKGMHQDTFDELRDEVQKARREWGRIYDERLRSLAKTAGVDVPV
jgi:hypothetical protein